jgi:pyruvate dehydrogenase E2 component (dihydrolipoamide acetyltransferase)
MPVEIKMPRLSDTMDEGKIVEWKKKVGDRVEEGDLLCVIETDKADVEFQAFYAGTLIEITVPEGKVAPLGARIALIAEEGEEALIDTAPAAPAAAPEAAREAPRPAQAGKAAKTHAPKERVPPEPAPVRAPGGRVAASPLARQLARDLGLSLAEIAGSGPEGRIVKADVEAALARRGRPAAAGEGVARRQAAQPDAIYAPVPREAMGDLQDLSPMRRTIAKRMADSWRSSPHFTLTMPVEMDRAEAFRRELNGKTPDVKISVNDFLVAATARALQAFPAVNASFEEGRVRLLREVNVGVAVAVEEGLVTPVIRNADRKPLGEIAREAHDLASRGRARKLRPEEYTGGSFTISNLGMFGVEEFAAIMNPPEGAILAVGAAIETPVVREGKIVTARMMRMTLSCDHRIIDGAMGSRFLGKIKEFLENPALLTV